MRIVNIIIAALFILIMGQVHAQPQHYCGTDIYGHMLSQDIGYRTKQNKHEEKYQFSHANNKAKRIIFDNNLPIVFQVIQNNAILDITDETLANTLERLNQAFRNVGPVYSDLGVDTHIDFCLVKRNENTDASTGIERYQSPFTDMSLTGSFAYLRDLQQNPSDRIYVQIVDNACLGADCFIAGFATQTGIVLDASIFNSSKEAATVFIHEMGHFLGLKHTFQGGCKNDNCLADGDRVCDTPPDNRTLEHCFTSSNSCTSDEDDSSVSNPYRSILLGGLGDQNDLSTNYMDYNWADCRLHFTQGQSDRMLFFIEELYSSLCNSTACLAPCEQDIIADFSVPDSIEVGSILTTQNLSIDASEYNWYINGNFISSDTDLSYQVLDQGTVEVRLEAISSDSLCSRDYLVQNVMVYCATNPCFDHYINEQYLVYKDCSENANQLNWSIINTNQDTLATSTSTLDSFYVNNVDFLQLCLHVSTAYCNEEQCEYITITTDGSEICNNEQDDDGDGLIDLFDPDCPCDDTAYQALCPTDCEIVPDSFSDIKMKMKWQSEVLVAGNVTPSSVVLGNNKGNCEIFTISADGNLLNTNSYISKINGANGDLLSKFPIIPSFNLTAINANLSLIKHTNSSNPQINISFGDKIYSYDSQGGLNYQADLNKDYLSFHGLADFNNDGVHEIYTGQNIVNGLTGNILLSDDIDCDTNKTCLNNQSIAIDIIGSDGVPELITGSKVYEVNISNTNDTVGNSYNIIDAPGQVLDGKCSVADFNEDGLLDIVVVKGYDGSSLTNSGIWIWNPRNQNLVASYTVPISFTNSNDGSIPLLQDLDNDCVPEIIIAFSNKINVYKFSNGILFLHYTIKTSDNSGKCPVTAFDLNNDLYFELIFRDQEFLKIINGSTGKAIDSIALKSRTWEEYPIIADIDNDNEAEIIVSGYQAVDEELRLYCFESALTPWAPARSVWNQYAYNPTQVNDDLTIPRYPQNPAQPLQGTENCPRETCSTPYNNFMVQATYRTQEGCYVWPTEEKDLSITGDIKCVGDSLEICVYTDGASEEDFMQGIGLGCYFFPLQGNPTLSETIREDSTCFKIANTLIFDSLALVINDSAAGVVFPPSLPNTTLTECDYTNNAFLLPLESPDFSIDIVDMECISDSLIFYIATDNVAAVTDISCIDGGCYFLSPATPGIDPQQSLLEITTWCFDYDSTTMSYQYQDTFRVAIPLPTNQSQMWWTINEGGFGPGLLSSEITDIYECNYDNNIDSISFDLSTRVLDLGPDITKCGSEIFTLYAGAGFTSYLWNDLSTDSIYSEIAEGLHYVEATDFCGRVYRDTIAVTFDNSDEVDLGPDRLLCAGEELTITLSSPYEVVDWFPSDALDCDTCQAVTVASDTSLMLVVRARNGSCVSLDSIFIERVVPTIDSMTVSICTGETYAFFGDTLSVAGDYQSLSFDCTILTALDLDIHPLDTTDLQLQICAGDSILFGNDYVSTSGSYQDRLLNQYSCDSLVRLDLDVVDQIIQMDTISICEGDSILIFGDWIDVAGNYNELFISTAGCDSIQHYQVNVDPPLYGSLRYELCPGDSVLVMNQWFYDATLLMYSIENNNACDSIIDLEIRLAESYEVYDTLQLCKGDTINVFGFSVSSEMDILETVMATNGCDSTLNIHVSEVEVILSQEGHTVCPGDSLLIDNSWYTDTDTISSLHPSVAGCDSIHTIFIQTLDNIPTPLLTVDCEQQSILASVDVTAGWQVLWDNGDTTSTTSYSTGTNGMVSLFYGSSCIEDLFFDLPSLGDTASFISYPDTSILLGEPLSIVIDLDTAYWSWMVSPASIIDCTDCSEISITPSQDTVITILYTHTSGCQYQQSFLISVVNTTNDIYIPNAFSPNEDGYNDSWQIYNGEDIDLISCKIYDRWGNLVYNIESGIINWDGSFKGKALNPGVFIYQLVYIDKDGLEKSRLGDLTLLR